MNLQLHWYIPDSVQTQIRAGREHIRTGSSYIMERSIQFSGNADKMRAREENMESECLKGELHKVLPAINTSGSDSAMLDNAIEFMVMSGMELPLAVMIAIPEPWANTKNLSQKKKDFYQYYATMMEPWDGPASDSVQ